MPDEDAFAGAGPALFRLVRFWGRGWPDPSDRAPAERQYVRNVQIVTAVDAAGAGGHEVTITDVARVLGLDHSGASRMVKAAQEQGLLARTTSRSDARSTQLELTGAGADLLAESLAWQEDAFRSLVAHWDPEEAGAFARGLNRLAGQAIDYRPPKRG